MSSEIEVVEEVQSNSKNDGRSGSGTNGVVLSGGEESLRNDVYTAAAYGDLEKLQRLVECEGCSVSEPDGLGYYALQWAALNNRTAAAQYIIEVCRKTWFLYMGFVFYFELLAFSWCFLSLCEFGLFDRVGSWVCDMRLKFYLGITFFVHYRCY